MVEAFKISAEKVKSKTSSGFFFRLLGASLLVLFFITTALAGSPGACLSTLTAADAAAVSDPAGRILYSKNLHRPHIPASTIKILTALAALQNLGPSYRFSTQLFLDTDSTLYIKGSGDPMLTSEVLDEIAREVSGKICLVERIVVDHSYFSSVRIPGAGTSSRSYDAPVGALSANFNTVSILVEPDGRTASAEPQTPLIGYALTRLGRLRLSGSGRHTFFHSAEEAAVYTGELLSYFLSANGTVVKGPVRSGVVPAGLPLLLTWQSPFTLEEVVERMMEFSNNFIANQLLIATGAEKLGPPGDLEKALSVVNDLTSGMGLKSLIITEGSGLSRNNRISASDMLILLKHFSPYRHLLNENFGIPFKTGTLSGLRTRAGYLEPVPGKPYPFVIFVNKNIENTDNLLKCLARSAVSLR